MAFQDSYFSTLKGNCNKKRINPWHLPGTRKTLTVKIPEFASKEVKLKAVFQRDKNRKIIKAPVVFYIPGAFSTVDNQQTRRYRKDLGRMGYHVISFPNPWGVDFIESNPYKSMGDIHFEIKAMYSLIKKANAYLIKEKISGNYSRLVGVSYGAFISTAISALNKEDGDPLKIMDTTIISPPIKLSATLLKLDTSINNSKGYIKENLISVFLNFKKLCDFKTDVNATPKRIKAAQGLIIRVGFFDTLFKSVKTLNRVKSLKKIPNVLIRLVSKKYRRWKMNFTFRAYFEIFAPENLKVINSKYSDLYYWKDRAKKAGFDNYRFLLSENDFLNDKKDIRLTKDTIVLKTGGHYGFRSSKWFAQFLKLTF